MAKKTIRVLIGMPTGTGMVPIEMVKFLTSMITDGIEVGFVFTTRTIIHKARNLILRTAVEGDFDYLFFLDDDNPPQQMDALHILLENKKDIVTGIVRGRQYPNKLCVFKKNVKEDGFWEYEEHVRLDCRNGDLVEIDNCGTGCVLLSKKAYKDIYDRYGEDTFLSTTIHYAKTSSGREEFTIESIDRLKPDADAKIYKRAISEDLLFFERLSRMGYKIYADTRVTCSHVGLPEIVEVGDFTFIK